MLELKSVEKKKTRNGGNMIVIKFWKAPAEFDELKGKVSYSTIDCFHILQRKSYGTFEDNWFKSFTTCLEESQFKDLEKGSKWMCLVMQEEQLIEKQGEVVTYEKGNRAGEDVVRVIPKIIEIHPENYDTSERTLDYLKLYKSLWNPQILEILGIQDCDLYESNAFWGVEFKFIRDDDVYIIKIRDKYIELQKVYNDISHGVGLVRLDNVNTVGDIRRFRKLMDIYFYEYMIREDTQEEKD